MNILDMIIWQSIDDGKWMPNNIRNVNSSGIEAKILFSLNHVSFEGNYAFTNSTNESKANSLDLSAGKQLLYVPKNKISISAFIDIYNWNLVLNQSFTDKVITSYKVGGDNYLDEFLLSNISLSRDLYTNLNISLKIENIFNKSYQTYQNYPNPGRGYIVMINYNI